jgi:hypothetical protein
MLKRKKKIRVPPLPPHCPFFNRSNGTDYFDWDRGNVRIGRAIIRFRLADYSLIPDCEKIAVAGIAMEFWRRAAFMSNDVKFVQAAQDATDQWMKWSE